MKIFFFNIILGMMPICSITAQCITGRVFDEQSQPMSFVNVVLLNRADSAFIMGTVTKDDGTFTIETDRNDELLKVSSIGYQTQYIQARKGNVGDIQMLPDNQTLGEVVVKGHVPSYRMTTEGIQTNVENTVLSKLDEERRCL